MRFTLLSQLLFAATAISAPHALTTRQTSYNTTTNSTTNSTDPGAGTTFRFLGGAYCLVPTPTNTTFGPCPVDQIVQLNFTENSNQTALVDILSHAINVTKAPAFFYANYHVSIDGVLRNATGQNGPDDLFGAGITRSYDYAL